MVRRPALSGPAMAVRGIVRVLFVMLTQQILAVIVAVWRADDGMDVDASRHSRPWQRHGRLVIELDQDDRTVDAVVKHALWAGPANPREPRLVQVLPHFVHFDLGVAVVHVLDV